MRKLSEIVVRAGSQIYHELIRIVLFSLASSAVLVPLVMFVPVPIAAVLLPLLYFPALYGVLAAFHRKAEGQPWGLQTVWREALRGFAPAAAFGALCVALLAILYISWWYYGGQDNLMYTMFAVFQTYFIAMALTSQLYTLPLVIGRNMGIGRAIAGSVTLFFRHPLYTAGACFQLLVVTAALGATVVGFAVLWAGMAGCFIHMAARNVLESEEKRAAEGPSSESMADFG
ncbi:hypothetical protein ACFQWB_09720 [Paenibacillus thermoaerophilus]|uniref:DUF624 domain-containing protein n=1 Tax=Paenibacillus thermoaerophilus TaxID=1215385 RepID=A0ABW2V5R3_9BACL|nr:hypothetical protein [Paenibacillus thermoaerophilus]TMV11124.1 hypothetical protein FE781_12650 [Paenibacillus thermoaerophilus]